MVHFCFVCKHFQNIGQCFSVGPYCGCLGPIFIENCFFFWLLRLNCWVNVCKKDSLLVNCGWKKLWKCVSVELPCLLRVFISKGGVGWVNVCKKDSLLVNCGENWKCLDFWPIIVIRTHNCYWISVVACETTCGTGQKTNIIYTMCGHITKVH